MAARPESNVESEETNGLQVRVGVLLGAVPPTRRALRASPGRGERGAPRVRPNGLHDAGHRVPGAPDLVAGYADSSSAERCIEALGLVFLLVTILGFETFGVFADLIALTSVDSLRQPGLAATFLVVGFGLAH